MLHCIVDTTPNEQTHVQNLHETPFHIPSRLKILIE